MEIALSVPFDYEPNDEVRRLLEEFRDMVNFCIEKALKHNITGFARLRKLDGITQHISAILPVVLLFPCLRALEGLSIKV